MAYNIPTIEEAKQLFNAEHEKDYENFKGELIRNIKYLLERNPHGGRFIFDFYVDLNKNKLLYTSGITMLAVQAKGWHTKIIKMRMPKVRQPCRAASPGKLFFEVRDKPFPPTFMERLRKVFGA